MGFEGYWGRFYLLGYHYYKIFLMKWFFMIGVYSTYFYWINIYTKVSNYHVCFIMYILQWIALPTLLPVYCSLPLSLCLSLSIYIYAHTYTHTYIYVYLPIYLSIYIYIYICIYIIIYSINNLYRRMCTRFNHVYVLAYTHTHTHIHIK